MRAPCCGATPTALVRVAMESAAIDLDTPEDLLALEAPPVTNAPAHGFSRSCLAALPDAENCPTRPHRARRKTREVLFQGDVERRRPADALHLRKCHLLVHTPLLRHRRGDRISTTLPLLGGADLVRGGVLAQAMVDEAHGWREWLLVPRPGPARPRARISPWVKRRRNVAPLMRSFTPHSRCGPLAAGSAAPG